MPRLNRAGRVTAGLGRSWLDEVRTIRQEARGDSWQICVDGVPVDSRGCNFLAAGGGFWLASIPGVGVFNATSLLPKAGLPAGLDGRGAASFDGAIAVSEDAQTNRGLLLVTADGVTARVPDALVTDRISVVSRTQALWVEQDGSVRTLGLPRPRVLPGPVFWPTVLRVNDEWWLLYHSTDAVGVVLHPFDSLDGYRVTAPPAFYLHGVAIEGSTIRVAFGRDAGEQTVQTIDVDVRAPRVRLGAAMIVTPDPVIPNPPKPETKPVPTIPESEIARAKAEIAAHPLGDNLPDLPWTKERVRALGGRWGLNGKRGNPNDPSHDIFAYRWSDDPSQQPILVDVLGDGGGANIEAFQIQDWPEPAGAVWISPGGSGPSDPSTPTPPPSESGGPGGQLDRVIAALTTRLAAVETANVELKARVKALEARPVDAVSTVRFPERIGLRANNGQFLCAEGGGGREIVANRDGLGPWETFTVVLP